MRKYLLDTNFILRFYLDDIPEQAAQARKIFRKARHGELELFVSHEVLIELDYVLRKVYGLEADEVVHLELGLLAGEGISTEQEDLFITALFTYEDLGVSLLDSLLYWKARDLGAGLLTFDKRLKGLG